MQQGKCGYGVTMLMAESVGVGKGQVEGLGGGGKGERNGGQRDDHW